MEQSYVSIQGDDLTHYEVPSVWVNPQSTQVRHNRLVLLPHNIFTNGIQFTQKGYYFSAPPSLGSYGFTDTYTDQGIMQLQMLLSHMQHQDEIAKLIMILL